MMSNCALLKAICCRRQVFLQCACVCQNLHLIPHLAGVLILDLSMRAHTQQQVRKVSLADRSVYCLAIRGKG